MPIPLAQIPNAPRLGPDPAMTNVPNANTNLSGVARNLMTPGMQQGAFDGAARGMGAIGDAVAGLGQAGQRISAVIHDANERKAKMQDDVSLATIDGLRSERLARYQGTLQGKSEDRWLSDFHEDFASGDPKDLEGLPLSEDGQRRLAIQTRQFMTQANVGLITSSNRSAVERGTGELTAQAQRQFDKGDEEGGRATVAQLVTNGAWRKDQADRFLTQVKETHQANELTGLMQKKPVQFVKELRIILNGKAVPPYLQEMADHYFSGPDARIKIQKWENQASSYAQGVQADTMNEVLGRMTQGETFDKDQLRVATEGKVDDVGIATLAKASANSPKYNPKNVSGVRSMLVKYDADNDKDMSQWMAIQNEISGSVPKEMQATFRSELDQEYSRSRDGKPRPQEAELRSSVHSRVDTYAKSALFGGTGMGMKTGERGKIVDQAASDKVWARAEQVKLHFDSWMKTHPGASPEDAAKWLNSVVNSDLMKAARGELDSKQGTPWYQWATIPFPTAAIKLGSMAKDAASPPDPTPESIDSALNALPPADAPKPKGDTRNPKSPTLSINLIDSVKQWESATPDAESFSAYDDYNQTSIGYGTRGGPGETITKAEAEKRLVAELETHAARVDAEIAKSGINLNQNQRNALISFDFNTGNIEKIMTSKSAEEIARRLPTWNKVTKDGKRVLSQGLVNRRRKELEMFNA